MWNKIKDKLPEKDKVVLIKTKNNHITDAFLYEFNDGSLLFLPGCLIPGKHVIEWIEIPE